MKKIITLMLTTFLTLCLSTSVFANTNDENLEQFIQPEKSMSESDLRDFFISNKVSSEHQKVLLEKLENNVLWDCYNEEKVNLIPKDFWAIDLDGAEKEKSYIFEDGSFIKIGISKDENSKVIKNVPDPNSATYDLDSRHGLYGTQYTNHIVHRYTATQSAWFYATFFVSDYNSSMIYTSENSMGTYNSPYGESVQGFGVTHPTLEIIRERESYRNAALVRMYWTTNVTVGGAWGGASGNVGVGGTCNLYLSLINSTVYIDTIPHNF